MLMIVLLSRTKLWQIIMMPPSWVKVCTAAVTSRILETYHRKGSDRGNRGKEAFR